MQHENHDFIVTGEEKPGCALSLTIEIKSPHVKKAYKKATKKINKEISIPGFRKGHAPDATVISRYSAYVDQEWKENLVGDAYRAALELTKIYPLSKKSIGEPKIERCSQEEGAVVLLSYEHYPEVPTVDFSNISLPPIEKSSVSEEQIEEILYEVRKAHADYEAVEGRSVEEGDFVDVSIDAIDEEPPKSIVKDRRFEVEDKKMAPWLTKLLLGLKVGETAEGISEVDETAEESVKARFKPTKVRVEVHAIKKILLPELDDELAKKAGGESKDDLLQKIRANLEKEAEEEQKQKRLHALDKILLETYPFDLPHSLVEAEREDRTRRHLQELKNQNLTDDEIRAQEVEIGKRVAQEAEESLRLYFLEKQIAKQGKISLTNEELNQELARQITQNPQYFGKEMDKETSRDLVSRLASLLIQQKTRDYALAQTLEHSNT